MQLPIFQVDAFTSKTFKGNPAAVVPLNKWLPDEVMQNIAMENNLSETAFFVPSQAGFEIRWFTPVAEVDLCGHATLATAHVIFQEARYTAGEISLGSRSGRLTVKKVGDKLQLDFPADSFSQVEAAEQIISAIGQNPAHVFRGKTDYLLVFENEEIIRQIKPNFYLLKETEARGVIVTAEGTEVDFVSRFFAPAVGIDEDPVTGSAHTTLTPFWATRLGKSKLSARQLSKRGGKLDVELQNDRVLINGQAVTYLQGEIFV